MQRGIYTDGAKGHSYCILFLKVIDGSESAGVKKTLFDLWRMLEELSRGIEKDIKVNERHLKPDGLSVLIGYGPKFFDRKSILDNVRPAPVALKNIFLNPDPYGGGFLLNGSGLSYEEDIRDNHIHEEHVALQFIADTEFATTRALVETGKMLEKLKSEDLDCLRMSRFYNGFQPSDRRGWLGFHDGVSNIVPSERLNAISVNSSSISESSDTWTINGTYMAYLRISINLSWWNKLDSKSQELLVGRDKITGCPLIGIDPNGNPVKDIGCPIRGTYEIIENGNEAFREHPKYKWRHLSLGISDEELDKSHVGRAHKIDGYPLSSNQSSRIFRQGYQYLEPSADPPFFRTGLNFVTFQSSPEKLIRILTSPDYLGGITFGGDKDNPPIGINTFLRVRAAGFFFVPPLVKGEEFPGSDILM